MKPEDEFYAPPVWVMYTVVAAFLLAFWVPIILVVVR